MKKDECNNWNGPFNPVADFRRYKEYVDSGQQVSHDMAEADELAQQRLMEDFMQAVSLRLELAKRCMTRNCSFTGPNYEPTLLSPIAAKLGGWFVDLNLRNSHVCFYASTPTAAIQLALDHVEKLPDGNTQEDRR